MHNPSLVPRALNSYAATVARLRRSLLGAVARYGRSQRTLSEIHRLAREAFPKIVAELKTAQMAAFTTAAVELAKDVPEVAKRTFRIRDHKEHGIVYPQVQRAVEFLQTRMDFEQHEYDQLAEDAQAVAFAVAKVQTIAGTRAVRDAIIHDVQTGGTLREFRDRVRKVAEASDLSDRETEALYRTHVGRAYAAGQIAVYDSSAVRSAVPYLLYSATHDSRVRPNHLALEHLGLNGTAVYRADDPIWNLYYPPWDWLCRCQAFPLSVRDAAARGVREAQEWLKTGTPPVNPEFVRLPGFALPKGWIPTGRRLSPLG